jgi:hypothetical protein
MYHRHLINEDYSLTSIDDIISRGLWKDWVELRQQSLLDNSLLGKIERICLEYIDDPYAQRYHFWMNYVKKRRKSV